MKLLEVHVKLFSVNYVTSLYHGSTGVYVRACICMYLRVCMCVRQTSKTRLVITRCFVTLLIPF